MATQIETAEHLDLSQQAISQMLASGVLPKARRAELDLAACRVAYIQHLREMAAGRASQSAENDGLDLVEQRAWLRSADGARLSAPLGRVGQLPPP